MPHSLADPAKTRPRSLAGGGGRERFMFNRQTERPHEGISRLELVSTTRSRRGGGAPRQARRASSEDFRISSFGPWPRCVTAARVRDIGVQRGGQVTLLVECRADQAVRDFGGVEDAARLPDHRRGRVHRLPSDRSAARARRARRRARRPVDRPGREPATRHRAPESRAGRRLGARRAQGRRARAPLRGRRSPRRRGRREAHRRGAVALVHDEHSRLRRSSSVQPIATAARSSLRAPPRSTARTARNRSASPPTASSVRRRLRGGRTAPRRPSTKSSR